MLIRRPADIRLSEIAEREIYRSRREFIRSAGLLAAAAGLGLQPWEARAGEKLPGVHPAPTAPANPSRPTGT